MNLLNVTIREVKKDKISLLPYARFDCFAFVLLFSQKIGEKAESKMKNFTQDLIESVLDFGGTFYLPYRVHYTHKQVLKAYPNILKWLSVKKLLDPDYVFQSQFFDFLKSISSH